MYKHQGSDLGGLDDLRLLRIEDVCKLLGLGRTLVAGLIDSGVLRSVKIRRTRRVQVRDLRAFVERFSVSKPDGDHYRRIDPTIPPQGDVA